MADKDDDVFLIRKEQNIQEDEDSSPSSPLIPLRQTNDDDTQDITMCSPIIQLTKVSPMIDNDNISTEW